MVSPMKIAPDAITLVIYGAISPYIVVITPFKIVLMGLHLQ